MTDETTVDTTPDNAPDDAGSPLQSAVISLARHVLTAFGTYAIAKGWLDQDGVNAVVGFGLAAIPAAISTYTSYKRVKATKAPVGSK